MSKTDYDRLTASGLEIETVGDLLGGHGDAPVAPVAPPRHEGQPAFPTPGIYFGMPEEQYHAIHAGSTSGLKNLSVSSMDYWANSALNRDREEQSRKDYFDFGKAIHCLVLEGEEAYQARYVVGLEKPKGVLETTDQIKTRIAELGHKPTTKGFDDLTRAARKEDWIAQLLALDPDAQVWERMQAAFDAEHEGAEIVTHKIDKRVRIAARMIEAHPELKDAFTGGYAEVSVFWYCPETGCPMKARFDYLKMRVIVDLKSFAGKGGMPIRKAILNTIASYSYNLQHSVYLEAAMAARRMIREKGEFAIHSNMDTPGTLAPHARGAIVDWCTKWAKQTEEPQFLFVFQKADIAPVTRGYVMPRGTVLSVTRSISERLKRKWVECAMIYGTDQWLDIEPIETLADEELPIWATDL